MSLQAESSSLKKGESLIDTVRTLEAMKPDAIVIRHGSSGAAEFISRRVDVPVINAGDGTHEHPTQGLLDALTIRDRRGQLDGCRITIIGDILHSRVARSNIHLLTKFGAHITLCGPAMWLPRELECLAPNIRRVPRLEEAVDGAQVVMALRIQQERLHEPSLSTDEYILRYQLTPARLRLARPDAIVLHPGPMIRGLEIDPAVADSPQSCVLEQVTNGLAIRMALLFELVAGSTDPQDYTQRIPRMLLIKNGRIIDPSSKTDARLDVLIDKGKIAKLGPSISAADALSLDAAGCIVAPGFIDLHCHLREPGGEISETIESGTQSAARGGFTAVCPMPNTQPVNDNASVTRSIMERAAAVSAVHVWPIGAASKESKGEATRRNRRHAASRRCGRQRRRKAHRLGPASSPSDGLLRAARFAGD